MIIWKPNPAGHTPESIARGAIALAQAVNDDITIEYNGCTFVAHPQLQTYVLYAFATARAERDAKLKAAGQPVVREDTE